MLSPRLSHAIRHAGLVLPEPGTLALWDWPGDAPLGGLAPQRVRVISRSAPDIAAWRARGIEAAPDAGGPHAASLLRLPRVRDLAETRLAEAEAATPGGLLVIDGARTDGIEALLKAIRARRVPRGVVSKAHGKVIWLEAAAAFAEWRRPAMYKNADGFQVAPGVFSAGGVDPGSRLLGDHLADPAGSDRNGPDLSGQVADLGAGWGWLSRAILLRPQVRVLHLVEADHAALACARANVSDPRARFHWADALHWRPPEPLDAVVMNPPFHPARQPDPALGHGFIDAAGRALARHGTLWLVANRHLPYEARLSARFDEVREIGGTGAFKLLRARRPRGAADRPSTVRIA